MAVNINYILGMMFGVIIVSSFSPAKNSTATANYQGGSKIDNALNFILGNEGQCQNWGDDKGNYLNGELGYTCAGILPAEAWKQKDSLLSYATDFKSTPAQFGKFAFDKDPDKFKSAARQIYANNYVEPSGCSPLPDPAFTICLDTAVNSGVGQSQKYLGEIKETDPKKLAIALNNRHAQDYEEWGKSKSNEPFLAGWRNRVKVREKFIQEAK